MKSESLQLTALLLAAAGQGAASAGSHQHLHFLERKHAKLHSHRHLESESPIEKRGAPCAFPADEPDLVYVPGGTNAGWAFAPDQTCYRGRWCPFACKSGMVMNQWDPDAIVAYPASRNGGLYCGEDGKLKKPFDRPCCVPGTGTVEAVNKCGKPLSFCQTVFPGDEDMLIPTVVTSTATLAVPGTSYWRNTGGHFYINPPGSNEAQCIWGNDQTAIGNWAAYVAGTKTDEKGQTFLTLSYNPVWQSSALGTKRPDYAVRIECPGGGCNGLPCTIDPSSNPIGKVTSDLAVAGAGDAFFCTVTIPAGGKGQVVVYDISGGSPKEIDTPESKPAPPPPPPPPTSTSTSSTVSSTTSTTSEKSTSTFVAPSVVPGIFHENGTSHSSTKIVSTTSTKSSGTIDAPPTTSTPNHGARQGGAAIGGLVIALVAAAYLF